jgi:hypothetical protein
MSGLITFLSARLDEDEAAAKAATDGPWYQDGSEIRGHNRPYAGGGPGILVVKHTWPQESAHIVRHDPARTLREVAAKRAILAEHGPANGGRDADRCRVCTATAHTGMRQTDARRFRAPCPTLLFLAAVYSDHPDYRAEWAVSPVG